MWDSENNTTNDTKKRTNIVQLIRKFSLIHPNYCLFYFIFEIKMEFKVFHFEIFINNSPVDLLKKRKRKKKGLCRIKTVQEIQRAYTNSIRVKSN